MNNSQDSALDQLRPRVRFSFCFKSIRRSLSTKADLNQICFSIKNNRNFRLFCLEQDGPPRLNNQKLIRVLKYQRCLNSLELMSSKKWYAFVYQGTFVSEMKTCKRLKSLKIEEGLLSAQNLPKYLQPWRKISSNFPLLSSISLKFNEKQYDPVKPLFLRTTLKALRNLQTASLLVDYTYQVHAINLLTSLEGMTRLKHLKSLEINPNFRSNSEPEFLPNLKIQALT